MKKIFPDLAERAIECAKLIGPETTKYTEWYIDQVNNHGLLSVSFTTKDSIDVFLDTDIDDVLAGKFPDRKKIDTEEFFKEVNAMHNAPSLPLPKDF